jgi:hypothetical protein
MPLRLRRSTSAHAHRSGLADYTVCRPRACSIRVGNSWVRRVHRGERAAPRRARRCGRRRARTSRSVVDREPSACSTRMTGSIRIAPRGGSHVSRRRHRSSGTQQHGEAAARRRGQARGRTTKREARYGFCAVGAFFQVSSRFPSGPEKRSVTACASGARVGPVAVWAGNLRRNAERQTVVYGK